VKKTGTEFDDSVSTISLTGVTLHERCKSAFIMHRLGLLDLAEELGDVSQACKKS
jgi:hypothetical protein